MFGRAPNFIPVEAYPYAPPQAYAAPQTYAPQAYASPPQQQQWSRPAQAHASHPAQTPQPNLQPAPRTYRGQESEEARLQLPSPEQLGLNRPAAAPASSAPAKVDWATVHQRLDRLGATCFHMEKVGRGARVTCLLPTAKADCSHRIEAVADSEVEAVTLAVAQAEQWANGK